MDFLGKIEPLKPQRISDEILNILVEEILTGKFSSGDKLPPERMLAEKFGVHRNSVREAIKKLEMLGLVEVKQGNGSLIKAIDKEGNILLLGYIFEHPEFVTLKILKDLLRFRYLLETDAAEQAATMRSEKELVLLNEILYQEERNFSNSPIFSQLDYELHQQIITASKNVVLQLVINSIKNTYLTFSGIFFSEVEVIPFVYERHVRLIDAIKEKNGKLARKIMEELLIHGEEHLLKKLQKGGSYE